MTRAKDISKIVTDADLSGTLDVTGAVTAGGLTMDTGGNSTHTLEFGANRTSDSQALGIIRGSWNSTVVSQINLSAGDDTTNKDNGQIFFRTAEAGTTANRLRIEENGDISFYEDTGTTPKLFWDASAESLGIGTTTPSTLIHLEKGSTGAGGGSDAGITMTNKFDSPDNSWSITPQRTGVSNTGLQIRDETDGRTDMVFDGSGNVGIGTSSPDVPVEISVAGSSITNVLKLTTTSSGSVPAMQFEGDSSGTQHIIARVRAQQDDASNGGIVFETENSGSVAERMRITSGGNLLVGTTTNGTAADGTVIRADGENLMTRLGQPLTLNRRGDHGTVIEIRKDNSAVGFIGTFNGDPYIARQSGNGMRWFSGGIHPCTVTGATADNAVDLGNSSGRFDDVFATNGTIQTSDRNEKQDIEELSDAEQRVAVVAKGLMRKFRWIDSVAEKGDNARTHFGIIAQDLQDAFTAEGLDASKYAMFTSNTWWEKEISVDAVEADEENGIEAKDAYTYIDTKDEATEGYTEKTRLGVRYNQLLAFIISAI